MSTISGWCWWLALVSVVSEPAFSNPQTNQLTNFCSNFNFISVSNSMRELDTAIADLRSQLFNRNKYFATSTQPDIYGMIQCRNYLSAADCVACFDVAVLVSRNCSIATGALVIFDGCLLRYQDKKFFNKVFDSDTIPGYARCGPRTVSKQLDLFNASVHQLLNDILLATPRIQGFYAAVAKQEKSGGGATIYMVAQCAETVSKSGCRNCLSTAYRNIEGCVNQNFADGRAVDAACFLRYSDTPFFSHNQTTNIAPFLGREPGKKKFKGTLLAGVVGGIGGIILVLVVLFFLYRRSGKSKARKRGNILAATQLKGSLRYRYKDLKAATMNFSQENLIGKGGFADVYKGMLENGDVVAIKKLATISNRVKADFLSEVSLITNAHHPNLIRLLGYSGNKKVLLLVYEFMANASLDRYIYGERRGMLNWKQRVDVIFGTAKGLAYLHEMCIIHRDIKPNNILLDVEFQPKIADFGLAKFLPVDKSHLTTKFAGTLGYTAPEYAIHGHLSDRVDTYSFGIVVLEVISGRKSSDIRVEPVTEFLLEQAWKMYEKEEYLGLVDKTLDPDEYNKEEMKRMLEIALVCTQSPGNLRPTMSDVLVMLSSTDSSIVPTPRYRPTTVSYLDKTMASDVSSSTYTNATISFNGFSGR